MKDEYIIINRTALEKRIVELEKEIKFLQAKDAYGDIGKLSAYKQILSQSTPLIPVIENAWKAGWSHSTYLADYLEKEKREEYISNLKLDI